MDSQNTLQDEQGASDTRKLSQSQKRLSRVRSTVTELKSVVKVKVRKSTRSMLRSPSPNGDDQEENFWSSRIEESPECNEQMSHNSNLVQTKVKELGKSQSLDPGLELSDSSLKSSFNSKNSDRSAGDPIIIATDTPQALNFESISNTIESQNTIQSYEINDSDNNNAHEIDNIYRCESDCQIDDNNAMDEEQIGDLKKNFRDLYGIQLDIPAFYVLDGKFYPQNTDFQLMVVKFQVPLEYTQKKFITHLWNQDYNEYPEAQSFDETFGSRRDDKLQLYLMKSENQCLIPVQSIQVEADEQILIEFSKTGKYLALFYIEDTILEFYEIKDHDLTAMMENVKIRKPTHVFHREQFMQSVLLRSNLNAKVDVSIKLNRITFASRFFSVSGREDIFIIDMEGALCQTQERLEGEHENTEPKYQPRICKYYKIDTNNYNAILDLNVSAYKSLHLSSVNGLRCEIACLVKGQNKVHIFDILKPCAYDRLGSKSIIFNDNSLKDNLDSVKVKISQNFTQVMLSYKNEHYLIKREKKVQYGFLYKQEIIKYLMKKKIQAIYTLGSAFYFVTCKDYDKNLDVCSSHKCWSKGNKCYKLGMDRAILPNSVRTFDLQIVETTNLFKKYFARKRMVIISTLDQQIHVDNIELQNDIMIREWINSEDPNLKQPEFSYVSIKHEKCGQLCSTWPYLAIEGLSKKFLQLYNFNNPNVINRIQIPPNMIEIMDTEITASFDLYVMGKSMIGPNKDQIGYSLFAIDLGLFQDMERLKNQLFIQKTVLEFTKNDVTSILNQRISLSTNGIYMVKGKPNEKTIAEQFDEMSEYDIIKGMSLLDFHIRGSDTKVNKFSKNRLIIFILMKGFIISYVEGQKGNVGLPIKFVGLTDSSEFQKLDSNKLLFDKKHDGDSELFTILSIDIKYGGYTVNTFYEKQFQNEKVIQYCLDSQMQKLIILSKVKARSIKTKLRLLRIIDLKKNQIIFKNEFTITEIIGRIKSMQFTLSNGHMYFDNTVCKIRYDLIEKGINDKGEALRDQEIFDVYDKVLDLDQEECVQISYPYQSPYSNKLIFKIHQRYTMFPSIYRQDDSFIAAKILIMPFLHERKIYLDRFMPLDDHFCLVINDPQLEHELQEQYGSALNKFDSVKNSLNTYVKNMFNTHNEPQNKKNLLTKLMVVINFTTMVIQAFQYNGIIHKRCVFKEICGKYGKPQAVSADGLNFLFAKGQGKKTFLNVLRLDIHDEREKGFKPLTDAESISLQSVYEQFAKMHSLDCNKLNFKYDINCDSSQTGDIVNDEFDIALCAYYDDGIISRSMLFILVDYSQENDKGDEQWIWIDDHLDRGDDLFQVKDISINRKFIFYWTNHEIFYKEIAKQPSKEFVKIDLPILPSMNSEYWIYKVYTGDADDKIAIKLMSSEDDNLCYLITWHTFEQKEINSFEIHQSSKVFFDSKGDIYSTQEDRVLITSQKVRLACFETEYLEECAHNKSRNISFSKGHHIDDKYHRWIFLHEFILLPYSYMSFVINQKFAELNCYDHEDFIFDIEQFNFIFDKKTCFTIDQSMCLNLNYMKFLLENLEKYDPRLLDLLQYFDESQLLTTDHIDEQEMSKILSNSMARMVRSTKSFNLENSLKAMGINLETEKKDYKVTPLHIATSNNDTKLKELILNFMTKIEQKNENAFTDIFPEFLTQPGFFEYFDSLQYQTQALKNKKKLKVKEPFDAEFLVKMNTQNCSFFDKNFFVHKLDEIPPDSSQKQQDQYSNFNVSVQAMQIEWIINNDEGQLFLQNMVKCENTQMFENQSIEILIDWLFSQFKNKILAARLPLYFGQFLSFVLAVLLDDKITSNQVISPQPNFFLLGFWVLILVVTANTAVVIVQIWRSYSVFFNQKWNYYELVYIYLAIHIASNKMYIYHFCHDPNEPNVKQLERIKWNDLTEQEQSCIDIMNNNRKLEAILAIVVWSKVLFFLQLSDRFAPLVQVIYAIIWEIRYFALLMTIIVLGFANSFYFLGKNQMAFDGIPVGTHPEYSSMKGSLMYMFKLVTYLDAGLDFFYMSATIPPRNTMSECLWFFWVICVFFTIVHLLNMLIGMMGNIQGQETEKRKMYNLKYKLNVVVDNWWINAINPQGLKYLISATVIDEEEEEELQALLMKVIENMKNKESKSQSMIYEIVKIKNLQFVNERR